MANVLDLSVYKPKTWEIKLFDGSPLHINKPSQAIIIDLMNIQTDIENKKDNPVEIMDIFYDIIFKILNNNADNKKISKKYVTDNFDLDSGMIFTSAFMEFVGEVQNQDF